MVSKVESVQYDAKFYGNLAKQLADNYKDIRDRGVLQLKKYIVSTVNKGMQLY